MEPKRKPELENSYREPRVKQGRKGGSAELPLPHDVLIKPESEVSVPSDAGERSGAVSRFPGSERERELGAEQRAIADTETVGSIARETDSSGEAKSVRRTVAASPESKEADEVWGIFKQRFGAMLADSYMRVCEFIYERSLKVGSDSYDTSAKKLAVHLEQSRRNVFYILEQLERRGFLRRINLQEGKLQKGLRLTLVLNPFAEPGSPQNSIPDKDPS